MGQNIAFHDLSAGLSQSTVSCITQDKQGYLWIGTEYGLNRFDGLSYKHFDLHRSEYKVSNANSINSLLYDDDTNTLWIGSYGGGLSKLELDNYEFSAINSPTLSMNDNHIRDLYMDEDNILWIATEKGGISLFDIKKEKQIYSKGSFNVSQLNGQYVTSVCGNGNSILVGTWSSGVLLLNRETGTVQHYFDDDIPIKTIIPVDENCFIVGTNKGLKVLSTENENCYDLTKLNEDLSNTVILSLLIDQQKRVLVGTENEGLYILDEGQVAHYVSNSDYNNQLSGNSIWTIYEDRAGIIWIGTHLKGLNKIDPLEGKFKQIQKFKCGDTSIELDQVSTILETEDRIWIGTDGKGLYSMEKSTGIYHCHDLVLTKAKAITALIEDTNGMLWVGTWKYGVIKYDYQKRKSTFLKTVKNHNKETADDFVHAMCKDEHGNIWVSYFGEKIEIYEQGNAIADLNSHELVSTRVNILINGCEGEMIIGTEESGIQIVSMDENNKIARSKSYLNSESTKISYYISDIAIDQNCDLWVATTQGLFHISRSNDSITNHSLKNELGSQYIAAIEIVGDTCIWGSTNKGIFSKNLITGKIEHYNDHDGLLSNQFLKGSSVHTKDGNLYFGNNAGVNHYKPENETYNKRKPEVYLTDILIADVPLEESISGKHKKAIELAYHQNDLTFKYTALNFTQSEQNQFKIRLRGLEHEWRDVNTRRAIEYTNLAPGTYHFEVMGSNNDRIWNDQAQIFSFTILQPWYNSWSAWFVYALVLFSVLYTLIKITLVQLNLETELKVEQLEIEKLKELDKMKSKFVANISHELLTPLTLIISPLKGEQQAIENNDSNRLGSQMIDIMLHNAERLKKHINQMLNLSKLESGSIKLIVRQHNFIKFLRNTTQNFKVYARDKGLTIHLDFNVLHAPLYYDEERMEQILSNLLSNAIKYSKQNGEINLSLSENEQEVILQIKDNGIGIKNENISKIFNRYYREREDKEIYGTGIGLSIVQQLVHLHKADISVNSKLGAFTTFTLNIKKGYEHFTDNELSTTEEKNNDSKEYLTGTKLPTSSQQEWVNPELPVVLLVEDNADIATYLMSYLQSDYNFLWAKDGQIGVDIALAQLPDIIISDVMMPNKNGFELCDELKSNEISAHIYIILLTVKASTRSQIEGYQFGADYYMTKPFNPQLLKLQLINIIKQKKDLAYSLSQMTIQQAQERQEETAGLSEIDKAFLVRVEQVILDNLSNSKFSVLDLNKQLGYSKSQLYRKLKSLINLSPNEFIRRIRLETAAEMISNSFYTISEITYQVGFNDLQYFRSCFKKQYGVTPSTYKSKRKSK